MELVRFAKIIAREENDLWTESLGDAGLRFGRANATRYDSDPINTTPFASTGVDGVHYSFLHVDGKITESSPVVNVLPMDFDEPFEIAGLDLHDFLGGIVGNGRLVNEWCEQNLIGYKGERAQIAKSRELHERIQKHFGVRPWTCESRRFRTLQRDHLHKLVIDFDMMPWLLKSKRFAKNPRKK